MTNFVVGKLGLTCRFDWSENKTNWFSPADDTAKLIINMSYNNPDDNFYICSKCGERLTNKTVSFEKRHELKEKYGEEMAEKLLKRYKKEADSKINITKTERIINETND